MSTKKLIKQLEGQLWHPSIGWQVLRRSKRYKAAFGRFYEAAVAVEGLDGPSSYAMEFASLPNDEVAEIQSERLIKSSSESIQPLNVRVQDVGIENVLFDDPENDSPRLDDLVYTPYCQNFLKEFGFALRFPINPKQAQPNRSFLEILWCMYPAAEYSTNDSTRLLNQFEGERNRLHSLNLVIDFNFSDEAIKRNVSGIVDEILARRPMSPSYVDKKPVSVDFEDSLKAFDAYSENESLTWNQLAKQLWPDGSPMGGRPEDLARSRIESIENLIEIFDKEAQSRTDT